MGPGGEGASLWSQAVLVLSAGAAILLAVWPWTHPLTSVNICLLMCKMG